MTISVDTLGKHMVLKGYAADVPFLKAVEQEQGLIDAAVAASRIYVEGRDAETWDALVSSLRGGPGFVAIFGTYRVFGDSRAAMMRRVNQLRPLGVVVLDLRSGKRNDTHGDAMLDEALRAIHGSRKMKGDRKFARKIGAEGGHAKYEAMKGRRLDEGLAARVWQQTKLTIPERLDLMPGWTSSTARRHLHQQH